MSRRSRRHREALVSAKPLSFATAQVLTHPRVFTPPAPSPKQLRQVEDRRTYHPLNFFRPARQVTGHPVKPNVARQAKPGKKMQLHVPAQVHFAEPNRTIICIRRKTRKQVLFAKRKTGKRGAKRTPRKNWYSSIHC